MQLLLFMIDTLHYIFLLIDIHTQNVKLCNSLYLMNYVTVDSLYRYPKRNDNILHKKNYLEK